MRSSPYLLAAIAACSLTALSTTRADAMNTTSPAGLRASLEAVDLTQSVDCRPRRYWNAGDHRWRMGCGPGVVLREGTSSRAGVSIESGGNRSGARSGSRSGSGGGSNSTTNNSNSTTTTGANNSTTNTGAGAGATTSTTNGGATNSGAGAGATSTKATTTTGGATTTTGGTGAGGTSSTTGGTAGGTGPK